MEQSLREDKRVGSVWRLGNGELLEEDGEETLNLLLCPRRAIGLMQICVILNIHYLYSSQFSR